MIEDGTISTRGLKEDAKIIDELVFDVSTAYFECNGGYEYARLFLKTGGVAVTSLQNKKGGETISAYNYTYYLDGNQAGKADHTGKVTNYTYDESRRLTQEAESGVSDAVTKNYTFDASSNRKAMSVTGAKSYTVGYKYDLDNRLLTEVKNEGSTTETTDYFYDNNGNTISKNTSTMGNSSAAEKVGLSLGHTDGTEFYVYDGLNQLVKAENAKGTSTYAYRPDGLRLSKTVNDVTTTHVWDGQDIYLDLDGSGNVIDRYIRGNGLIRSDKNGWYLYNAHGDVVQLSSNSGAVTKTYDYDAFGAEKNADEKDANPYRYCGEYFDRETGTVYLRARYYDPEIGRFVTEDSYKGEADDPLSLNLYTYCNNNPVMMNDPSGHDGEAILSIALYDGPEPGVADAVAVIGYSGYNVYIYGPKAIEFVGQFGPAVLEQAKQAGGYVVNKVGEGIRYAKGKIDDSISYAKDKAKEGVNWVKNKLGGGSASPGDPNWNGGFKTFNQLKRYLGSAGKGNQWHHIVEQSQIRKSGFDTYSVNNVNNVVRLSDSIHKEVSRYYSQIHYFTDGMRFRDWLAGKSFQEQYEWGIKVIRMFGGDV